MKRAYSLFIITLAFCLSLPAFANSNQAFSTCLVDSLNGKERRELAKWIFLSMTAHPEIQGYSKATDKDKDESNRFVGKLTTRC